MLTHLVQLKVRVALSMWEWPTVIQFWLDYSVFLYYCYYLFWSPAITTELMSIINGNSSLNLKNSIEANRLHYNLFTQTVHLEPRLDLYQPHWLVGCSLLLTCTVTSTHTWCPDICFCIIHLDSSSVQNRPFWFIPLDRAMIA